jgi:hypothetical protein
VDWMWPKPPWLGWPSWPCRLGWAGWLPSLFGHEPGRENRSCAGSLRKEAALSTHPRGNGAGAACSAWRRGKGGYRASLEPSRLGSQRREPVVKPSDGSDEEGDGSSGMTDVSYLIFMLKSSTHRMHDPGSNVLYIRPK